MDEDLSTFDWVLCVLCSGLACIIGVVRMIQGKPSGKKMVMMSILFSLMWGLLNVVLNVVLKK